MISLSFITMAVDANGVSHRPESRATIILEELNGENG